MPQRPARRRAENGLADSSFANRGLEIVALAGRYRRFAPCSARARASGADLFRLDRLQCSSREYGERGTRAAVNLGVRPADPSPQLEQRGPHPLFSSGPVPLSIRAPQPMDKQRIAWRTPACRREPVRMWDRRVWPVFPDHVFQRRDTADPHPLCCPLAQRVPRRRGGFFEASCSWGPERPSDWRSFEHPGTAGPGCGLRE